jgi:hypothetical protein
VSVLAFHICEMAAGFWTTLAIYAFTQISAEEELELIHPVILGILSSQERQVSAQARLPLDSSCLG